MAIDVRTDRLAPALAPATPHPRREPRAGLPALWSDGRGGTVERVVMDRATGAPRELIVRTGRIFRTRRVVPASWVTGVTDAGVTLRASRAELNRRPAYRSDARVLRDLRASLRDDDPIRLVGLRNARFDVADGVVTLSGRVPSRLMGGRMVDIVRRTPGVRDVVDRLIADDALELAVGRAISRHPLTRGSRLSIKADRGRVTVGGVFPSREAHAEALRVAAGVDGVVDATG
jgi:osmotically-inducible protein OsmY